MRDRVIQLCSFLLFFRLTKPPDTYFGLKSVLRTQLLLNLRDDGRVSWLAETLYQKIVLTFYIFVVIVCRKYFGFYVLVVICVRRRRLSFRWRRSLNVPAFSVIGKIVKRLIWKILKNTTDPLGSEIDSLSLDSAGPPSAVRVILPGLKVVALVVDGGLWEVWRRGNSRGAQGSGGPLPDWP